MAAFPAISFVGGLREPLEQVRFRSLLKNGIDRIPVGRTLAALEAVCGRTPAKINSFKYSIKEILATPGSPLQPHLAEEATRNNVQRIRDDSVGLAGFSYADFVEDIKCACARDGPPFANDIFNELVRFRKP